MAGAKLRIICGPTAAGKSEIALELATTYDAAIISADSRQIYCGFDIGTAKPTREECARATHYGIDVAEPEERFSAARWAAEADEWIESACEIEKEPIIAGGTGLYIKALVEPFFPAPELGSAQRTQLARELESKSIAELRRWCRELDPARAHLGRTQMMRAIETAILSGKRISDLHAFHNSARAGNAATAVPTYLVVDPGASLAERIVNRIERMLGNGWIEEVEQLSQKIPAEAPAWKASGYAVIRQHLQGDLDLSTAKERVIIETRQYAKRQRTWFRHQLPSSAVTHVNPGRPSSPSRRARVVGESSVKIGITCYPTYGGSGAVATELGIALADRGHEIHFITYRQPFRLPSFLPRIFFHEVDVGRYPLFEFPPYDLALAVRMHEVVRTHGLELLHCHYAIPHATSAWIAREMLRETGEDVHLITTLHGTDITIVGQDPSFYPITKFSIEKSDLITAVSEYLREETCRAFGCEGLEIEVIHNFIDPDLYKREKYPPLLKNQFGATKPILMHVSNFRAVKRVRDVVRIYAEVNRELPCVLVMIGDGPDRPAAEEEARILGVEDSVSFLGKLDQIAPLLAAADLFLLPSQTESFGLSALEALASGVPVVGSDAGGLPEVIRDGETGILCPVGDIPGMAAAALEILRDRTRWAGMSALAARDARERFSRDAIVTKYESLYQRSLPIKKS